MSTPNPPGLPTVSRVLTDGRIVELLYDADRRTTAFAVAKPDGGLDRVDRLELDGDTLLTPYSATNNLIASGSVLLPSDVGVFDGKANLVAAIEAFLHRYVDLSPTFEKIAAHYVLLSWVYDAFNELPYIRFQGDYGAGKTRALLALGHLAYKAFFASGASTISPIFHVLDAFQGTLILDEADFRFSDATAPLTKILNNGTMRGLPVLRTMSNRHREFNPRAFQVYGPKIVAMRGGFADRALESRFLTEPMGLRPLRADIPIQLPDTLATEAQVLRNQLLAWRFAALREVGTLPDRAAPGVEPRINQTALSLLSLVDDQGLLTELHEALGREQARVKIERGLSLEGVMVKVLIDLAATSGNARVGLAAVTEAFNRTAASRLQTPASIKWVGWFVRTNLHLETERSNGVYAIPARERAKLPALAQRFGLETVGAADPA